MDHALKPDYEFWLFSHPKRQRALPRIRFSADFVLLCDLADMPHFLFDEVIKSIQDTLDGKQQQSMEFGGERLRCIAYPEGTYCEDMLGGGHPNLTVDTHWMLQLLKEFLEFKSPYTQEFSERRVDPAE